AAGRRAQAQHVRLVRLIRAIAAGARIAEAVLAAGALLVFGTGAREVLRAAVTAIRGARRNQALGERAVNMEPLHLEVGPELAPDERPLVPVEPEPAHRLEDRVDRRLGAAALVGVLDAQDERAAVLARPQPVVERGARAPEVQVARRRRG